MMKRSLSSILGVTLLEIMLVLAIAAMIIVMSIRYYQSANASSQANALMQQIQAITAAADNIAQGAGGVYSTISTTTLMPLLPGGSTAFTTPWGQSIAITGAPSSYNVTVPQIPPGVCAIVLPRLKSNNQFTSFSASCNPTAPATIGYTYDATM